MGDGGGKHSHTPPPTTFEDIFLVQLAFSPQRETLCELLRIVLQRKDQ